MYTNWITPHCEELWGSERETVRGRLAIFLSAISLASSKTPCRWAKNPAVVASTGVPTAEHYICQGS
jgi:hypothetical protein